MEDHSPARQNIILENRRKMTVSGVQEIIAFDPECVRVKTSLGVLTVRGSELRVQSLLKEKEELFLLGKITTIQYGEERTRVTWKERLFG